MIEWSKQQFSILIIRVSFCTLSRCQVLISLLIPPVVGLASLRIN